MSVDTFKPRELTDIAELAVLVQNFNRDQHGDKPLFAEVVFYRGGDDVASLTETASLGQAASDGALSFEVKEKP
ncbi:hypothetical protein ACIP5T_03250 [Microbacterium sp. NPDC088619]|uniref:hypothetical protein n=1 Tax=Microbacterium sp. NPDC088619 TaxID=3364196 RepID=UPI0038253033